MAVSENDLVVGPLVPAAGVTTISLDFYFEQASWLEVYKSGSDTPLVLNTDYTVTGAGTSSGVVTLATAANGTDAYSVYLVVPLQRSSDMQLRGEFKSEPFNIEMDRLWQSLQRLNTLLSRTARLRMTATYPAPLLPAFPETGKALVWGADGNLLNAALDTGDIAVDVAAAEAARAGAEAAQSAAEGAQAGAETAQGLAETAQAGAETAEINAETAQGAAEAARDAAFVNADVYPDIATGRAAVADTEQFMVVSTDGTEIVRYRRDSASTQTEMARYPSAEIYTTLNPKPDIPSHAHAVIDQAGAVAKYVDQQGQTRFARAKAKVLNGHIRPLAQIGLAKKQYGGNYLGHSLFTANLGQSLGQTHVGGANETLTQVARSFAYPADENAPDYATDRLAAVATDDIVTGATITNRDGENPQFGLMAHTFEMLETERGLTPSDHGMYRVSGNNAAGSTSIVQNNQGTDRYNRTLAQVTQELAWGNANGVPVICPGNLWSQGEAENLNTKAYYLEKLTELATDYATDIRAILDGSGASYDQTFDPILFTYATCGRPIAGGATVARAQLQAAVDYYNGVTQPGLAAPSPVVLTAPTYFMDYSHDPTGIHVPAAWSYMIGAYGALAIQRIFIDEWDDADPAQAIPKRWAPMHPIDVRFIGNTAIIKYKMRLPGVRLEWGVQSAGFPSGDGVSEQENYGFAVRNVADTGYETIATPEIVAPDTVAIRLSSGTFADGHRIGYAMDNAATNWTFFTGNAGNLRDNHGAFHRCEAMNLPMHNWLAPHYVTKDTSPSGWTMS